MRLKYTFLLAAVTLIRWRKPLLLGLWFSVSVSLVVLFIVRGIEAEAQGAQAAWAVAIVLAGVSVLMSFAASMAEIEAWYVDEGGKERLEAFVAKADTYRALARGERADSGVLSVEEPTRKEQEHA